MAAKAKAKLKPNKPMSVKEAADYLRCGKRTVYKWIDEGRLPAWKLGPQMFRVDRDDVERLYVPVAAAGAGTGGQA